MTKKIFSYWKEFLIIAISIIVIKMLFFSIHPQNTLVPEVSSSEIKNKAIDISGYLKYNSSEYSLMPAIKTNAGMIADYQKKYGIEEGNKLVQKNEKAHFWEITWLRKSDFVFGEITGGWKVCAILLAN